jgi:AcrR family transcriptional regulator
VRSRTRTPAQPSADAGSRKPRADARRNRARLLEVAEAVFATKGIGASTEEIAREAGVGVGTLFRHFPTKEALLEAVFVGRLQRLAETAQAISTAEDPATAFFTFFALVVHQAAAKNAFADALEEAGVNVQHATSEVGHQLSQALETLLGNAQQAGTVRDDIGVTELKALLVGASRAVEHTHGDPAIQSRTLAVVLDGLRSPRSARPREGTVRRAATARSGCPRDR